MHRTDLVTGIAGQDGSYLTELLLSKEYLVRGESGVFFDQRTPNGGYAPDLHRRAT